MTELEKKLNQEIPQHTAVILNSNEEIYHSGTIAETNRQWELLPFLAPRDIYQMAYAAINGSWYRVNWMQF